MSLGPFDPYSGIGLYRDPLDEQKDRYLREMNRMQQSQMAKAFGGIGHDQAQQTVRAVPQPDPGTNPVLLLTGEDE